MRVFSVSGISSGTLIIEHIATCSSAQQQALLEWLDTAAKHVQIIATIEPPLFDLLQRGGFSDRLNTIHLDFHLPT